MIQAGTYKARATQVLLTQSKTKATPVIQVNFEILDEGEHAGESIRWDGWLTEKTAARTFESLRYCGWAGDNIETFTTGALDGCDLNDVSIVIQMEPYDGNDEKHIGKSFPRVQWVNKAGGRGLSVENAMPKAEALSFAEKMKGLAVKSRGAAPVNGAQAAAPAGKPAF